MPGPSLEVIKTEFFFQLWIGVLTDPSSLEDCSDPPQVRLSWQIGEIILLLPRVATLADKPRLLAGKMLLTLVLDPLRGSSAIRMRIQLRRSIQ